MNNLKCKLTSLRWENLNKTKILLWISFYCGIAIGCLLSRCEVNFGIFSLDFMNFNNLSILYNMISCNIGSIVLLFFISFTFFGMLFSFLSVFFKGLGLGIILSNLYSTFLFKGIFFGIFIFLPGAFISSTALIVFALESFKTSWALSKNLFSYGENNSKEVIKFYIKKLSQCMILSIIGTILTFVLCCLFNKAFNIGN